VPAIAGDAGLVAGNTLAEVELRAGCPVRRVSICFSRGFCLCRCRVRNSNVENLSAIAALSAYNYRGVQFDMVLTAGMVLLQARQRFGRTRAYLGAEGSRGSTGLTSPGTTSDEVKKAAAKVRGPLSDAPHDGLLQRGNTQFCHVTGHMRWRSE
jgi:hypothetical protein